MAFTLARSTSHSRHFRRLRIFDGATVVASGVYTRHLLDDLRTRKIRQEDLD